MLLACDSEQFALKMGPYYLQQITEAVRNPDQAKTDDVRRAGNWLLICIDHKPDLARDVPIQLKAVLTLVELGGGIVPEATRSIVSSLCKQTLDGHHM